MNFSTNKGQRAVAGFLYWLMAIIIVALLLPTVRTAITTGVANATRTVNSTVLIWIFNYWPVYFGIMILIILVVVIK